MPAYDNITYATLNLAGEAGEVVDIIKKDLFKPGAPPLNKEHLIEELGDVLWAIEVISIKTGISRDQIERANIKKLRTRFGIHG